MAIQNDNTLVTKGDLKSLYTDKIAPYLGGGISYYYTDRTGKELKCGDYNIQGNPTIPVNTSQNTHLNLSARGGTHPSDFLIKDGNIVIPEGTTVTIASNMVVNNNDNTSEANSLFMIYDYKNSANIGYASAVYHGNGVARTGSYTYNFTAPEGGAEIGIKCTYNAVASRKIGAESGLTITEIGRIVDPIKYVDNNSDLEETPVGNIISYMGNNVPKHYLACDGQTYPIGSYPELEAHFITEFGSINYFGGDGTSTFAVPDLKGEFLRGTGTNSHTNQGSGADVGEHQDATEHPYIGINTTSTNTPWTLTDGHTKGQSGISPIKIDKGIAGEGKTGTTALAGTSNFMKQGTWSSSDTTTNYTSRPTNTSVQYCIKYESTYHAFFSNAAYKVSIAASVDASSAVQLIFDSSDIIGDSSLVSGNSLVAPMDGWYSLGMNWSQSGSGDIGYYIRINGASGKGYNRGIFISDTLYLNKGDVITIWKESGSANSGRVNFCLLTSNYNPTIVSADSVYSENEQMVGYWTDGKPLYQKVLTGNVPTTNDLLLIFDDPNAYIVAIPSCSVDWSSDESKWFGEYPGQLKFYSDANNSKLYLNDQPGGGSEARHFGKPYKVVIQYTKTTDTASTLQIENSLLLNRPDLWEDGVEYHFGGGLYGARFTGTVSASVAAGSNVWTQIINRGIGLSSAPKMMNFGGWIEFVADSQKSTTPVNSCRIWQLQTSVYFAIGGSFRVQVISGMNGTTPSTMSISADSKYDIWVTYKK